MKSIEEIPAFCNDKAFLSNMFLIRMIVNGIEYSCLEAAFQSFKTTDLEERKRFSGISGKEAKALGRRIKLRKDWESWKEDCMLQLLRIKFSDPDMAKALCAIEGPIVETNTWGDTYWGVCNGVGKNRLGKLLEQVRTELANATTAITSICVTGHRPDKLFGYNNNDPRYNTLRSALDQAITAATQKGSVTAYTGMALGVDTIFAEECLKLKKQFDIKLVAAVPFKGQEGKWQEPSKKHYHDLLSQVDEIVYVSDPGYAAWKMQKRNEYMVNHSDLVIAVFDGTAGGTANCVNYAKSQNKQIYVINPRDIK